MGQVLEHLVNSIVGSCRSIRHSGYVATRQLNLWVQEYLQRQRSDDSRVALPERVGLSRI